LRYDSRVQATDVAASVVQNVAATLEHWARRRGAHLAVCDSDRRLTYTALWDRVGRLAGCLADAGVGRGDRVGIVLANRSAYLEAVFAAAQLGAIALPVHTRLSPRELGFILSDAEPAALVYEADVALAMERAIALTGVSPKLRLVAGSTTSVAEREYEAALVESAHRAEVAPVRPDEPMLLMYTSGTTGTAKGALLPHRKTLFNSLNAHLFFGIRPDDRVLVVAPLFHSLGLLILSVPALYAGATLVLRHGFAPGDVWHTIEAERITYTGGVPTMYQRLYDWRAQSSDAVAIDASSLRFMFTAGAAIPVELIHAFERLGLVLKQGYGQTETSILCCLDARDAVRKAGTVGLPVRHVELRVVRCEDVAGPVASWRESSAGETGEIVVRGPITMLGYWRRPDATAETLREDGWLRTGDLGTRDAEGFIALCGRARDMYISGGENVYPAEIENVYAGHPAIAEIAVIGVPDPTWGEVGRAHAVLRSGASVDPHELNAWGRERLAAFKLPRHWSFERELPRTETGKVQKHRLGSEAG
jgi:fatty-acyl-CoA synthase